jgi:hydroxymethylpyrimidine/phosphomethylpyrimidine kinase
MAPPKVLTIAGSDSGGAAGLQADLRTFAALGVYGLSALTVVTAQNSEEVSDVHFLPASFVTAQLTAVLSDYGAVSPGIMAAKTGFIGRAELIPAIAAALRPAAIPHLIVDPVLVNHKGEAMFDAAVSAAYRTHLAPAATLLTPNWREAALLAASPIRELADLETAVFRLQEQGAAAVLVTGYPDPERPLIHDLLLTRQGNVSRWQSPRRETPHTHGSGDTLSAAICAYLARGADLETAVAGARSFTIAAIDRAAAWRLGGGHGPVWQAAQTVDDTLNFC